MLDKILMVIVGLTFIGGGLFIVKNALEAKNLIETSLFGLLGVGLGIFLIISCFCGLPNW